MPIDLATAQLAEVRRILHEHVPDCEVWAFGSRVSGAAKAHSDLDLAIASTCPIEVRRMALLADAFAESDLPIRVDVIDLATTAESFRRRIIDRHEVVQPMTCDRREVPR